MIKRLFGKVFTPDPAQPQVELRASQLDMTALPILTARELLEYVGYDATLSGVYRLVGLSEEHFDTLYRQPTYGFALCSQLAPASENNHHSGPGGLLQHTLEVIENALHIRRSYQLPLGGSPEEIAAQEHIWTYGLFIACLLHDIGKLFRRIQLIPTYSGGRTGFWTPQDGYLSDTNAVSYAIAFNDVPYRSHQRLSLTMFGTLIPKPARAWLTQHPEILDQVINYLWGEEYESQVIADIAIQADRRSTAKNLDIKKPASRLPGAADSLADRMIKRLRQLIDEREIKYNQDGGMAWVTGEYTYFVCRPLAMKLISSFEDTGTSGMPQDPVRIYNVLQEHGFAIENDDGGAVFKISIEHAQGRFSHTFTCLKFKTRLLWRAVRLPQPFEGTIRELGADKAPQSETAPAPSRTRSAPATSSESAPVEHEPEDWASVDAAPASEAARPPETVEDDTDPFADPVPSETAPDSQPALEEDQVDAFEAEPVSAKTPVKSAKADNDTGSYEAAEDLGPATDIKSLDWTDDVGTAFLDWVKQGIHRKTLSVNNAKAGLHFVEEGVFLVSPRIFQHFVKEARLGNGGEYTKLQKRFARLKVNLKTKLTHQNVHRYTVDTGNKQARLNGWLLPYSALFDEGQELPKTNKFVRASDDE
ncbi:MobH family relaxase [Gilvimarinus sp. SDUM040013]|uniref:MobH family relaxase n=1 Tax=Gilvimarinus gilvus TaxID=3058038 RepID=A0ABU4S204_9GAMM|nr:MobH family relaxase [Gilvimarinus sp. SDUM040013]MDO3388004.1 MobH family relaxase [Gilvimarinus sp. SDUM040013]MDX6851215.1 MobH family relaxase [Gilvimarinus sp. SDUM040013]